MKSMPPPEPEVARVPAVEPEPDYTQELIDLIDSYPATLESPRSTPCWPRVPIRLAW